MLSSRLAEQRHFRPASPAPRGSTSSVPGRGRPATAPQAAAPRCYDDGVAPPLAAAAPWRGGAGGGAAVHCGVAARPSRWVAGDGGGRAVREGGGGRLPAWGCSEQPPRLRGSACVLAGRAWALAGRCFLALGVRVGPVLRVVRGPGGSVGPARPRPPRGGGEGPIARVLTLYAEPLLFVPSMYR